MSHKVNYEAVAPTYDRRYVDNVYPGTHAALVQLAQALPELRALEVGCGTGHWLAVLHELGARVAGLDASASMLEHPHRDALSLSDDKRDESERRHRAESRVLERQE